MNMTVESKDIIRQGKKAYANVKTSNGLIRKLIGENAEDIYSFSILFGSVADQKTKEEFKNSYWVRVPRLDEQEEVRVQ